MNRPALQVGTPALQRARGAGPDRRAPADGPTRLAALYQDGCAKIRLPRRGTLEAVLINTSGGLTGGDRLDWQRGRRRGPRSRDHPGLREGLPGPRRRWPRCRTPHRRRGAQLDWLPQETILFDGGALSRGLEADLAEDARLLAVEAVVLGRTAMGETVRMAPFRDRWRIRREGRLVFADDLRLDGAIAELAAAPLWRAHGPSPRSSWCRRCAPRFLEPLRAAHGRRGGASAFDGKLFARLAAPDGFTLRQALLRRSRSLRDGEPPRLWFFEERR